MVMFLKPFVFLKLILLIA
jgi:hypothetical protein